VGEAGDGGGSELTHCVELRSAKHAHLQLGKLYAYGGKTLTPADRDGATIAVDEPEALSWFVRGAEQGDVDCMFCCASMLNSGMGDRPRRAKEAAAWYRKAVEQGDTKAMYNLAQMLLADDGGLAADFNAAESLLAQAVELGNAEAAAELPGLRDFMLRMGPQ